MGVETWLTISYDAFASFSFYPMIGLAEGPALVVPQDSRWYPTELTGYGVAGTQTPD